MQRAGIFGLQPGIGFVFQPLDPVGVIVEAGDHFEIFSAGLFEDLLALAIDLFERFEAIRDKCGDVESRAPGVTIEEA